MVDVLHTVIQTVLYVRSSAVCNLYRVRRYMYHHCVASKVIVTREKGLLNIVETLKYYKVNKL
jgi:hypothetical protein